MSKLLWNLLKATPLVLGASVLTVPSALAATTAETTEVFDAQSSLTPNEVNFNETNQLLAQSVSGPVVDPATQELLNRIERSRDGQKIDTGIYKNPMSQVNDVNQLRDVEPTAWAYEALRNLVNRYGCIVGYPDRTFRGDRALTRWEFAAGVNACLAKMEELLREGIAILQEDIDTLTRLAKEFETELAALGARIENLEQRVAFLEDHQFSTTTKLKGEVVFSIADTFGDAAGGDEDETQTVFQNRVRLNLETSFTGTDLLKTRLQAGNFNTRFDNSVDAEGNPITTGTNMTRLAYDDGSSNDIIIDDLFYRFSVGDVATVWIGAKALNLDDVFYTVNPYLSDSGTGALSRLQRYNNMVYRGPSGTGLGVRFGFGDTFNLTATYLADDGTSNSSFEGDGLFNGSYSAGAQIGINISKTFGLGLTYVHSYQTADRIGQGLFGNVSSLSAEQPFGAVPTSADRFGIEGSLQLFSWLNLGAWGGYAKAYDESNGSDEDTELWTWNANVSFVDFLAEGAVLSIGGGMPPQGDRRDTSYMVEGQFKFPVTNNIFITPGVFVIFNPESNSDNDTQFVGVIRTTFRF